MNKEWMKIFIAAIFEVGWVIGLNHAESLTHWTATVIAIYISFHLLIASGKKLPVGTAYAVFTGLGTAGTVAAEVLFFGVPFQWLKLFLITFLLSGVIGLKFVSEGKEAEVQ
ncbi:DMT family transporter [Halobacillus campisalis]|uniref:DMT family transporter n=1 Tax=Halobacillus campisalis TaxID=435909 RepID=A0ABW2K7L1_9BACI|nr:multidrug efflux SMR transporter [Halobacillus campisalis]